jgi:formiminotetrahydrofolate cyclodeaminase
LREQLQQLQSLQEAQRLVESDEEDAPATQAAGTGIDASKFEQRLLLVEQKITKIKDETLPSRIRKVNEVFDEKLKLQSIKDSTKIKEVKGDLHRMKTKVEENLNKINMTL